VLWVGCADSRVPETTVCDARPGDVFVHRNIANLVSPGDAAAAAVVEFAVAQLHVRHVVVCGHTCCGGARAALTDADLGPALNAWLQPLRELRRANEHKLALYEGDDAKANRLAELNVRRSVESIKGMETVAKAIAEGKLSIHGLIYDIPGAELKVLDGVA
jgi:carbonic anhydrase